MLRWCHLQQCWKHFSPQRTESASKMIRTVLTVGNVPQKSADTCNHGPFRAGDIFRGSLWELSVLPWQGMQLAFFLSTLLSIPGNHTFDRRSCLVLTIPRCPSLQMLITCSCRLFRMTSWWPRVTTPMQLSSRNTSAYFVRSGSDLQAR